MNRHSFSLRPLLAASTLLFAAGLAQAQYVWIDEKGIKQFSDRSPPSSIPDKNILKSPGKRVLPPAAADTEQPRPPAVAESPKGPPTVAERDADYKKRVAEQAERDKKTTAEAQQKAAKAEQCAAAREYKTQLASGVRIGTLDKNGEPAFMSDADRANNTAKADKVLAGCK